MALSLRLGQARERIVISRRRDVDGLAAQLQPRRYLAAYALAQLEPGAWERSEWWSCVTSGGGGQDGLGVMGGEAIVCHSLGGLGAATTLLGAADGVGEILALHPGPARTFAICEPHHLGALEGAHELPTQRRMLRMLATRRTFRPVGPLTGETLELSGRHVQVVNRLYSSEGGPTRYAREHIEEGCYQGVVAEGRLVAVAGTHSISRRYGISVLGNVFTHPQQRGFGFGTAATSAATAALLRETEEVVLSVDPQNEPAVRAYRRLGYVEVGAIVEASASRRVSGVQTTLRRWLARRRGGGADEIVLR